MNTMFSAAGLSSPFGFGGSGDASRPTSLPPGMPPSTIGKLPAMPGTSADGGAMKFAPPKMPNFGGANGFKPVALEGPVPDASVIAQKFGPPAFSTGSPSATSAAAAHDSPSYSTGPPPPMNFSTGSGASPGVTPPAYAAGPSPVAGNGTAWAPFARHQSSSSMSDGCPPSPMAPQSGDMSAAQAAVLQSKLSAIEQQLVQKDTFIAELQQQVAQAASTADQVAVLNNRVEELSIMSQSTKENLVQSEMTVNASKAQIRALERTNERLLEQNATMSANVEKVMERLNDVLVEREEIANEFKNYKKRGHLAQAAAFVEPLMQTVAEKGQETLADKGAGLFAFVTGAPGPEEEQAPAAEPEPEPAPRTPPPEPEPEIDPNDKLGVMWGFVKNAVFPPPQ